jgi:hypothetical protein
MRVWLAFLGMAIVLGAATPPKKADRIVIVKSAQTLTLMSRGQVLKSYKVALGGDPVGPKVKVGDKKTPEGEYVIDSKNAKSWFHLALHISYPNTDDRERARKLGASPGGENRGQTGRSPFFCKPPAAKMGSVPSVPTFPLPHISTPPHFPTFPPFCEGRAPRPHTQRVCAERTKVPSAVSLPALAKCARTGHPFA